MSRWPTIVALLVLVAALVFADYRSDTATASEAAATVVPDRGSGATWYCPAGFVTPDESANHIVTITNPSDTTASGSLTLFPSLNDTTNVPRPFERAVQQISLPPFSQQEFSLASLVVSLDPQLALNTGAFVGALVETDRSAVTTHHTVVTPLGVDSGPCADAPSASWSFASGTTTADVRYLLYVLNPFPDDAVIDISVVTDDGTRTPGSFRGQLVQRQSLIVIPVDPEVAVRPQAALQVTAKSGRVIVERLQEFRNDQGPQGLSLALGAPAPAEQWFFPAGRSVSDGAGESYIVFNPTSQVAEIEFETAVDAPDRRGDVAPSPFPIGPGERWIVTVDDHASHPDESLASLVVGTSLRADDGYFASVRSFNGVPVVVERIVTRPVTSGIGVSAAAGITHTSDNQVVGLPPTLVVDDSQLAILNPAGDTIARIEIFAGSAGGETLVAESELPPRRRGVFRLQDIAGADTEWIRIVSTEGVMAELIDSSARGITATRPSGAAGSLEVPELLVFD